MSSKGNELGRVSLCRTMDDDDLRVFGARLNRIRSAKGTYLVHEGELLDRLFIITGGRVHLQSSKGEGASHDRILQVGESFCERALFQDSQAEFSARCPDESTFLSANVANLTVSSFNRRVALVEGDLRFGNLDAVFGRVPSRNLADLLRGEELAGPVSLPLGKKGAVA